MIPIRIVETLQIRPIETKDIHAMAEFRLRFLRELAYSVDEESCLTQTVLFLQQHLGQHLFGILAENEGRLVSAGILLVQERPYHPFAQKGKVGEVLNLFTEPDSRGKGYGRLVFEGIINLGRELGLDKLILNATQDGYNLYKSCGFTETQPSHPAMELKF
ncbi:MAG: GNAT family N-acetyltransferase [Anaerolineaceae bacterium]|nr:GNAT family N-acetyltransferase [Anaerolineaceae bacterium]